MGVREGTPGALAELARKVRDCQAVGFKVALAQTLAATALHELEQGFLGERDPYGKPWAPLKYKRRRGARAAAKILRDTGRMYNSRAVEPTGPGFRLTLTAKYAATHQYGDLSRGIPRRQMVPEKDTGGLGPIWLEAFNKDASAFMRRRMGKAA